MMDENSQRDDEMASGLTVDQYATLGDKLKKLPDAPPPRAVWGRIETQARAEGLLNNGVFGAGVRWLAGSGVAAAVVLAVLGLPALERTPSDTNADDTRASLPTEPTYDPETNQSNFDTLSALRVQSQLLEQDLRRMPSQPQVVRAGTLATIDDLQERIAAIDLYLSDPALPPEQQAIVWRERVRLMESLVRLRYAQTQSASF